MKKTVLILLVSLILSADQSLHEVLQKEKKKISVLLFYTTWCPPCKRSVALLNQVHRDLADEIRLVGIDVVSSQKMQENMQGVEPEFLTLKLSYEEAQQYGLKESIPALFILDEELKVLKSYHQEPEPKSFLTLLQRLKEGYLANGVPPISQRVDLWKKERK